MNQRIIRNLIATVNCFYEKCGIYFEEEWDSTERDRSLVLKEYYFMMFRNSIHYVEGYEKTFEELAEHTDEYLKCMTQLSCPNYVSVGMENKEELYVKLEDRYRACREINLNFSIVTVYLYMNQKDYLEAEFPDQTQLAVIFYLVQYDNCMIPDEVIKLYEGGLEQSVSLEEYRTALYKEWKKLLIRYFGFVMENLIDEKADVWNKGLKGEAMQILSRLQRKIDRLARQNTGIKKVEKQGE